MVLSLTAPKEERNNDCNYRTEPSMFFISKVIAGKTNWNKVKCYFNVINVSFCCLFVTLECLKNTRFATIIAVIGKIG